MVSKFGSKGAKVYAVPEGSDGYDYNRGPTIVDLPKKYDYEEEGLVKETKIKGGYEECGRILPVSNSEGFAHAPPPSDLSGMINSAVKLDDAHYTTFAQMELKRLMTEGKITNRPSLLKKDHNANARQRRGAPGEDDENDGSEFVERGATPKERALIAAVETLKGVFPTVEQMLASSADKKTLLMQQMARHAADRPKDAMFSVDKFSAYMSILGRTIADRSAEVSFLAMQCFIVVVKSYREIGGDDPPSATTTATSEITATTKLAINRPRPPLASMPSSKQSISDALFLVVPILLDRLSTRNTAKELKQIVAKCLLALCKNEALDGISICVPFLGSNKFALQQRLFILRLLTKEFGLETKGSALNCPLIMNVALDAIKEKGEKVKKEGIRLIVVAALSVGIERVKKYFRLKKIDESTCSFLEGKILEGQAKEEIRKAEREKRRQDKKKLKKQFDGGGLDSVLEKAHEASFADNTTYIKSPVARATFDDEDLGFWGSDDDDEE